MGHLHALWHAALDQSESGDLTGWSDEFIAESSDYPGDAPQYVRLLQQHRWLDGKIIHDWVDYAGLYLTRKYSTSKPRLLVEIWAKHGRIYGANEKRTNSEQTANLPNLNLPNQPNQPNIAHFVHEIYEAYPRKTGRPKALLAIKKALQKIAGEQLLERTRQYAVAVSTKEKQFIPYPATWFTQERFNDLDTEWNPDQQKPRETLLDKELKELGKL